MRTRPGQRWPYYRAVDGSRRGVQGPPLLYGKGCPFPMLADTMHGGAKRPRKHRVCVPTLAMQAWRADSHARRLIELRPMTLCPVGDPLQKEKAPGWGLWLLSFLIYEQFSFHGGGMPPSFYLLRLFLSISSNFCCAFSIHSFKWFAFATWHHFQEAVSLFSLIAFSISQYWRRA